MSYLKNVVIQKQASNPLFRKILTKSYYLLKRNKTKIKGTGNKIEYSGSFLSQMQLVINGNNNSVVIEEGSRLSNVKIYINGDNHKLHFGKNCYMKRGVIWFEDNDCLIEIGDETTIMEAGISVVEPNGKIVIGQDCMLSFGIDIRNSDSHSIIDIETQKRINPAKDVHIGNHVWIGHQVQILKGTSLENNSIVGSRSVVTKAFQKNCAIAGTPAKVVKTGVTWDRRRL